ncbi:MAG: ChbG/HpnK family deacetylase [Candidatus Moranbacteria bacterium]|nr:ChbG/HpnK family deacetylase [Candidatus Moranbacteria bacterium]MDD3964769.1 ChbG/HpnK family deacetylase [Candidatus Moranbacteria bacterium]
MNPEIRERFIITADDYGIRQTAEPILRLVRAGKLDRVAVMIRYISPEEAQALLETGVKIDLHLELIDILKSGEKMYDGVIKRGINFVFRLGLGIVTAKKAEEAWRTQIDHFQELFGRVPDGLDSHEHLHYFPSFFRACARLAEEYHIPFIRFGREGLLPGLHGSLTGKILHFFSRRTQRPFAETHLTTTDYVVSLDWFSDFADFITHLPKEGTIELVVHPERDEDYDSILKHF